MPKFQGQTDKITRIQMTSVLLHARWGSPQAAQGGEVPIEVQTQYVGDGSEIKVTVKDHAGATVDSVSGCMYSNLFRSPYRIKPGGNGSLYFEAELPAHHLKGKSGPLKVVSVKLSDLKWCDEAGKETLETGEDAVLLLQAKCVGAPDDTPCDVVIHLKLREESEKTVFQGQAKAKDGAIEMLWKGGLKESVHKIKDHTSLDKVGEDYYPPELHFRVACLGAKAESPTLKVAHLLTLKYQAAPGKAGPYQGKKITVIAPDGERVDHTIPADGLIEVKQSKPGLYRIDETKLKPLAGEPDAAA